MTPPTHALCDMQAAQKAAVEQEARLIAFDRQNHMGITERTAKGIQDAIQQEAAAMHEAKLAKAVVSIQDNADRMKEMKVGGAAGR